MTASPDRGRPTPPTPASDAIRASYGALAERVAKALAGTPRRIGPMLRVEVTAPAVDPLSWLAAQGSAPRIYWSDRDQARSMAGVGVADRLTLGPDLSPADLMARVAGRLEGAPPGIRYFGGFRFDPEGTIDPRWRTFGRGWLTLPRFEWVQEDDAVTLACNVFPGHDSGPRVAAEIRRLGVAPAALAMPRQPRGREDLPRRADWLGLVERVSTAAANGGGGPAKVVLARRSTFTFDAEVEALALLRASRQVQEPCFHFFFDPGGGAAFAGASPERLFHRRGREVTSEALAGTRRRGATPDEDARLRGELLRCAKEGREHASVVRHIEAGLLDLTEGFQRERETSVVELTHVQHLSVRMRGRLRPGVTDATLLAALHPTPAVAGDPPHAALSCIADLEPFDRGWYAGPVGYAGADDTQFAVAIRSALVQGHRVDLYAGAGILPGSRPADEWGELESKTGGMQAVWAHG